MLLETHNFKFGEFLLDMREKVLLRDGKPLPITPKAFHLLSVLLEKHGHLVEKNELMKSVWADSFVEEGNLTFTIGLLRKLLDDDPKNPRFIETVPRRGYRFIAEVRRIKEEAETIHESAEDSEPKQIPKQNFPRLVGQTETQKTGGVAVLAEWRRERDKNQPEESNEKPAKFELVPANADSESSVVETSAVNFPQLTKRRKGLFRGLKILLWGLSVGFVFYILVQVLIIAGVIFVKYENSLQGQTSNLVTEMIGSILTMIYIPVGLGFFTGIGLFLFGIARVVYALFEKENSKIRSSIVEWVMAGVIVVFLFLIAIPNLIVNYREAKRNRQFRQVSVSDKKSIAVLPVKPINTANRDEIYEIGIADSLIYRLSSMKGFVVRPLSATRKYADINQDPIAAGREQQADYVLVSNYQLAGGRIRITAQLLNVASGQVEESYKTEKNADNIFAVQDAIAGEVESKLLARFATTSTSPAARRGTASEEAYRLYLQGRNLTYSPSAENARKGIEYFGEAVRLDPNFARAYSGMAHAFIASAMLRYGEPREQFEKARLAAQKALELDPNLGDAYAVSGQLKFYYEWDYPAAEKDLLRALELEPNSDLARKEYATFLAARGRFDEAVAEINTALEIDPNSLIVQQYRGRILYLARRYDEAILQFTRAVEVNENLEMGWIWASYELKGDEAQAYEWFIKSQKRKNPERIELFQNIYKTSGWRGVRQKQFELQKQNEQQTLTNYYEMARQCAFLGDKEQAFEYLNKAVEKRQGQMFQLYVEPPFDSLRDDPRFDELVRRVGLK